MNTSVTNNEQVAEALFEKAFGVSPEATKSAPGRVNLIGDYTDIAEGFVLPTPLPHTTAVSLRLNDSGTLTGVSSLFDGQKVRAMDTERDGSWTDYVMGCVRELEKLGHTIGGLDVAVHSDVPLGAGVSSSAALETASLRALRQAMGLSLSDQDIARLGQGAENSYVGLMCGLMDQMVSSVGISGHALFFDTRTMETENIPLFHDYEFLVMHSGLKRQLVDGAYNDRFDACTRAAEAFGVDALRDATMAMVLQLEGMDGQRARHVVRENDLVLNAKQALEANDASDFGALMTESHWSLSKDFETSLPQIDKMVEAANANGALGARITGAGFGGCMVALVAPDQVEQVAKAVTQATPTAYEVCRVSA